MLSVAPQNTLVKVQQKYSCVDLILRTTRIEVTRTAKVRSGDRNMIPSLLVLATRPVTFDQFCCARLVPVNTFLTFIERKQIALTNPTSLLNFPLRAHLLQFAHSHCALCSQRLKRRTISRTRTGSPLANSVNMFPCRRQEQSTVWPSPC